MNAWGLTWASVQTQTEIITSPEPKERVFNQKYIEVWFISHILQIWEFAQSAKLGQHQLQLHFLLGLEPIPAPPERVKDGGGLWGPCRCVRIRSPHSLAHEESSFVPNTLVLPPQDSVDEPAAVKGCVGTLPVAIKGKVEPRQKRWTRNHGLFHLNTQLVN